MAIKHAFESLKVDGSDPTKVQPSNWNDDHVVDGVVITDLNADLLDGEHAAAFQDASLILDALAGLAGTVGFVVQTSAGVFGIDTSIYLTVESDTLDSVVGRNNTTAQQINVGGVVADTLSLGPGVIYDSTGLIDFQATDLTTTGVVSATSIVTTTPKGYAEMYMYGNVTACVIDTANLYHAILHTFGNNDGTLAPLVDTNYFTRKLGEHYVIASVATYAAGAKIQCTVTAGHALLAGEPVTISGSSVPAYNGTYLVEAPVDGTTFVVTVGYSATATASVRRPATLKCLVAGYYQAAFAFSGTAANPNDNIKIELNRGLTPLDNIGARGIWSSTTKYETLVCSGLVSLAINDYVWASVKNYDGANNITFYSGNVNLRRLI